jgi:phosphoketolase
MLEPFRLDILSETELQRIYAWWRAANYLSAGHSFRRNHMYARMLA